MAFLAQANDSFVFRGTRMNGYLMAWLRQISEDSADYALVAGFLAVAASGVLCMPGVPEVLSCKLVQLKAALV